MTTYFVSWVASGLGKRTRKSFRRWDALESDKARRTFLFHLLKHAGQDNQGRWHTVAHDFEEFADVAKKADDAPTFFEQLRMALA